MCHSIQTGITHAPAVDFETPDHTVARTMRCLLMLYFVVEDSKLDEMLRALDARIKHPLTYIVAAVPY